MCTHTCPYIYVTIMTKGSSTEWDMGGIQGGSSEGLEGGTRWKEVTQFYFNEEHFKSKYIKSQTDQKNYKLVIFENIRQQG